MNNLYNTDFDNANYQNNNIFGNFNSIQKARKDLISEILAVLDYDENIHSSNNRLAIETWKDIKSEELVHVGELLALLNYLDSSQTEFVEKGIREFNERMNNN